MVVNTNRWQSNIPSRQPDEVVVYVRRTFVERNPELWEIEFSSIAKTDPTNQQLSTKLYKEGTNFGFVWRQAVVIAIGVEKLRKIWRTNYCRGTIMRGMFETTQFEIYWLIKCGQFRNTKNGTLVIRLLQAHINIRLFHTAAFDI